MVDLPRTFPALRFFGGGEPFYNQLREVLEVFVCYRPDLGYIQGMSYLAAMLCLYTPDDTYLAFQTLANLLVSQHLFVFYRVDRDLICAYCDIFDDLLKESRPTVWSRLREYALKNIIQKNIITSFLLFCKDKNSTILLILLPPITM